MGARDAGKPRLCEKSVAGIDYGHGVAEVAGERREALRDVHRTNDRETNRRIERVNEDRPGLALDEGPSISANGFRRRLRQLGR